MTKPKSFSPTLALCAGSAGILAKPYPLAAAFAVGM